MFVSEIINSIIHSSPISAFNVKISLHCIHERTVAHSATRMLQAQLIPAPLLGATVAVRIIHSSRLSQRLVDQLKTNDHMPTNADFWFHCVELEQQHSTWDVLWGPKCLHRASWEWEHSITIWGAGKNGMEEWQLKVVIIERVSYFDLRFYNWRFTIRYSERLWIDLAEEEKMFPQQKKDYMKNQLTINRYS